VRINSHCAAGNCTLGVGSTLVRVEITLVRVVIADLFLKLFFNYPHYLIK
jgi:hypothetical protein